MTVEIADVEAAFSKVRDFIALLQQHHGLYDAVGSASPSHPQLRGIPNDIQEQLPLISRIAQRADPELADKLKKDSYGWPYYRVREASQQLAGLLDSLEEAEGILGRSDRSWPQRTCTPGSGTRR